MSRLSHCESTEKKILISLFAPLQPKPGMSVLSPSPASTPTHLRPLVLIQRVKMAKMTPAGGVLKAGLKTDIKTIASRKTKPP